MDTWIWVVIAVAVVVLVVVVVALAMAGSRRRRHLRDRFGPEYDRTVGHAEHRRDAERELREREARHDELDLRPLSPASRERFTRDWDDVQRTFVDRPQVAVADADRLVTDLMRERGYPVDDFETKRDLVSVDHPRVVEHYGTAHDIAQRNVDGRATTEDLRRAVVSYRALFEELLSASDGEHRGDETRGGETRGGGYAGSTVSPQESQ
ncbi:MAG: hypothetical protein U0W40_01130 [Acidimicrobiia bacterium]